VDEFLDKLAEDQRRMRKFLRTQGPRFKKMGDALALARERGMRIWVVGEPPLDQVAGIIATEYLGQLPAIALSVDEKSWKPEESKELEPMSDPGMSSAQGPPLIARHLSKHFRSGDVLVVVAHSGQSAAIKALLGFSKLKGVFAILIGGLDAREQLRRAADTAITLPTRGVKTVCEASFTVARIMARVARARVKEKTGEEEERLVRLECTQCHELIFVEERFKGKKGQCPLCRSPLRIPEEVGEIMAAHAATSARSDEQPIKPVKDKKKKSKRPLKQSVLMPVATDEEEPAGAGLQAPLGEYLPISEKHLLDAAGEATSSEAEPPVGLSSRDESPGETVVAPEDVAFDEFSGNRGLANATESADPFALPDAFVADLVMPQGRPGTSAIPPSDANPITGSGERESAITLVPPVPVSSIVGSSDSARGSQLVSARFSVQDCKVRFGRGGYPDDTGPENPLDLLSTRGAVFSLDPQDELGQTVEKGDELWMRISVPAFIEPVLVRGIVQRIGGTSDGGRAGTRVDIEWKDLDATVTRKLARAAESLGAASGTQ
jgi:hypothetical protein